MSKSLRDKLEEIKQLKNDSDEKFRAEAEELSKRGTRYIRALALYGTSYSSDVVTSSAIFVPLKIQGDYLWGAIDSDPVGRLGFFNSDHAPRVKINLDLIYSKSKMDEFWEQAVYHSLTGVSND